MAANAGGELAAAVCRAGGLGLIGAGHVGVDQLKAEVAKGRQALGMSDDDPVPWGVGLYLWKMEAPHLSEPDAESTSSAFLSYVVSISPHSVWLAFSPDLEAWVRRYRAVEASQGPGKRKAFVFVMASRTQDTVAARTWPGVDVVVAQGTEAGGHGPGHDLGLPLDELLDDVSSEYPATGPRPYLVAAGGLSSASSVSRTLKRFPHVAGVVSGTAFTVATESLWPRAQKELVVRTPEGGTARGLEWDEVRNALGWPRGVDGRAIKNSTNGTDGTVRIDEGIEGTEGGPDLDVVGTWAGTGVGDVRAIRPAAEILADLVSEL
ncbi:hypothetical protein JCM10212_003719 [Sporobolomyces blumeae]